MVTIGMPTGATSGSGRRVRVATITGTGVLLVAVTEDGVRLMAPMTRVGSGTAAIAIAGVGNNAGGVVVAAMVGIAAEAIMGSGIRIRIPKIIVQDGTLAMPTVGVGYTVLPI
jgi:hypothetical protein